MADDSIFSKAGFSVDREAAPAGAPVEAPSSDVTPVAAAPKSIFQAAGFRTSKPVVTPVEERWKDAEALENLAASGVPITPTPEKPKQGRGIVRALLDYPGHLLSGLVEAAAGPGNVLASTKPMTSEDMIPTAVNLAGLTGGAEFPRATAELASAKIGANSRAVNALVDAIGPENVPDVVGRLQSNPRLSIADVSDPVRTMAQGLIDPSQPKVQNLVAQKVKERQASLPAAVNSAYTEAMGPAPNVVTMVEGLKSRAREAGQKAIQPAIANAKPVDISPVVAAIDAEIQPGIAGLKSGLPLSPRQEELWRLRNQLINPETGESLFDASRLHQIQSQTGDKAFNLQKSADGWTRDVGNGLRSTNEKLIDAIDEASGGAYRPARAQFKDAKDISEAFETGFDTLKNRSGMGGLQDRPESFREWMKDATPEEVVARRLGTRADIDQKIRGVKNQALAGQSITQIEYNQEKLRMLFGDAEANRLIRVMKDAQDEAATNAKLLAGSKTAETLAGREALKVRDVQPGNPLQYAVPFMSEFLGSQYGIPGVGGAMMGIKGVHLGAQKIGQWSDMARNYAFAQNALATGAARRETINALLSHPKVVREFKGVNALAAPVGPLNKGVNALAPPP